jgi:hypothetical protein
MTEKSERIFRTSRLVAIRFASVRRWRAAVRCKRIESVKQGDRLTLASIVLSFRLVGREDLARILLHSTEVLVVGIPHEVLENLIRILVLDHEAGSLDDIAAILNELLTVCRKLGMIHDRVVEDIFESGINLLVGGITPLSECLYGTVEVELNEAAR